tara:strand:+ start:442 stop:615 length:174 start_codon:yes stop_codon:yes gene_type:complete
MKLTSSALLTISIFLNNYKHGFIAVIFNLFIHPTIGLLTLSYLFLSWKDTEYVIFEL